jgi:hypothetical protein
VFPQGWKQQSGVRLDFLVIPRLGDSLELRDGLGMVG